MILSFFLWSNQVTEVEVNWLRVAPNAPNSAPKPVGTLDREMLRYVTVIGEVDLNAAANETASNKRNW